MSAQDKNYNIFEMAVFEDQLTSWSINDSPLYYYEYSGLPAWFTTFEIVSGKYLPIYQVAPPIGTTGTTTITVLKKEWFTAALVDTITITITVNALSNTPWKIDLCKSLSIVWLGPFGGWESYIFEGTDQLFQTAGQASTFINQSDEIRFQDRGEIYQGVIHSTKLIPTAHIESLANMHKSIQAYLWQSGTGNSLIKRRPNVFLPILIKPKSFKKAKTREPFISYDFEFTIAKFDVIQNQ
jgi:hypothetical protein